MTKRIQRPSKEYLEQEYTIEERSMRTIAEDHNCSPHTVASWVKYYGIPKRERSGKIITPPPKEELENHYLAEQLSTREAGVKYGCAPQTVVKWLNGYDIKVRQSGRVPPPSPTKAQLMMRHRQRPVCNTLRRHAEDLKDDPERLSTEFMQDLIGVRC